MNVSIHLFFRVEVGKGSKSPGWNDHDQVTVDRSHQERKPALATLCLLAMAWLRRFWPPAFVLGCRLASKFPDSL
jgi:hypothetical protein